MSGRIILELMVCAGLIVTAMTCVVMIGIVGDEQHARVTALSTVGASAVGALGGALWIPGIMGRKSNGTTAKPPADT